MHKKSFGFFGTTRAKLSWNPAVPIFMQELQEICDKLTEKVDGFLEIQGNKIKVNNYRAMENYFYDKQINEYLTESKKEPKYFRKLWMRLKTKIELWDRHSNSFACYCVGNPNNIFVNVKKIGEIEKKKYFHVTSIEEIICHEITHERVWSKRKDKKGYVCTGYGFSHANTYLDEGFCYYVADKIIGFKQNNILKIMQDYKSGKLKKEDLKKMQENAGLEIMLNKEFYAEIFTGFNFCQVVEKELGKQELLDIAFYPLKEIISANENCYRISEEEIKNPDLYIKRRKK